MERWLGFIGPSYTARAVNVDAQRCVNLYPELNELGTGKEQEVASLVGTPGLVALSTLGAGPVRGLYYSSKARTFAVSGNSVYEVTVPASPTLLGTLTTNTGRVGMTDNGIDMVVVDGAKGYYFTFATNTFGEITDTDFPPGANVAQFLDQYIIVNEPGTGRFWYSAISGAQSWNALDFASAEGAPDTLHTLLVDHRELILFGDRSIEVFFNTGDADNPFQRIQGAFLEEGALAGSEQKLDNTVFYVTINEHGHGIVKRAQGAIAQRISTHAVELAIASYGVLTGTRSYVYQDSGHSFYCLNFPNAPVTWVFDAAIGLWHERQHRNTDGTYERHLAEVHVFDGTRHLVGDYRNGTLYELSSAAYTDAGLPIERLRRTPHLSRSGDRSMIHALQVDVEAGVGQASGTYSDPMLMLRVSKDGGHTFGEERVARMGKIGQFNRRAIWHRLGTARDWVIEVKSTDAVKHVWIAAYLNMERAQH